MMSVEKISALKEKNRGALQKRVLWVTQSYLVEIPSSNLLIQQEETITSSLITPVLPQIQ
jgi:hypothetical protein